MTDKQTDALREAAVKHMADRFLAWKLPDDFNPDGGVSYDPIANAGTAYEHRRHTTGTNLLTYTQAKAMIEHVMEGLPGAVTDWDEPLTAEDQAMIDEAWEKHKAADPALAQPAPEPEGYYALLQTGDSITIRNDTFAPMKVPVPSGASVIGDCEPAQMPAPEPPLTFRDRAMLAALTGLIATGRYGWNARPYSHAAREAAVIADALCAAREPTQ